MLNGFPLLEEELSRADARRAVMIKALAVQPGLRAAAAADPFREQLLLNSLQALHSRDAILAGPYFWAHLQSAYAALAAGCSAELDGHLDRLALAALDSFVHAPAFRWQGRLTAPPFVEFQALRLGVIGRRGLALREMYWTLSGPAAPCLNMVFADDGEFEVSLPPARADGSLQPAGLRLATVDASEFDIGDNVAKLETGEEALADFRAQLARARNALRAFSPAVAAFVEAEAWYLVPLRRAERHLSFSLSRLPRVVFIGGSATAWPVIEALVHEAGHLHLNRAAEGLAFANGPRVPVCYSPWRDDPRPVDGLVHGTYAFTLVLHLWLHALATRDELASRLGDQGVKYAEERVATLGVQLADAHAVLTRCDLSAFGSELVARLRSALPPVTDLPAAPASLARARSAAAGHRQRSSTSFPHLIAPASAAG